MVLWCQMLGLKEEKRPDVVVLVVVAGGYLGTEFFNMVYDKTGLPTVLFICAGLSVVGAFLTLLLIDLPWSGRASFNPHDRLQVHTTRWLPVNGDLVSDPHPDTVAVDSGEGEGQADEDQPEVGDDEGQQPIISKTSAIS